MYNSQYQGNSLLLSRDYSQPQPSLGDGMNNADKKASHYTDYSNLSAQMPVPTPYGVLPETLNDYRTAAYYAAAYPYGLMYDNRMVYMQAPQGYSIPITQDNQTKNKRIPAVPTQYVDSKSVSNDDVPMGAFQYAAHYPAPQPSLSGYPAMVNASQYPINPMMVQQGMMLSYPPQTAPIKRDASSQNLYPLNDKSAKKPALPQRMQRMSQVPYGMVAQPILSTPVVSMQPKSASPDVSRMPPKFVPPTTRVSAGKPEVSAPTLEKSAITDMERMVAGILCHMKSTAPGASAAGVSVAGAASVPSATTAVSGSNLVSAAGAVSATAAMTASNAVSAPADNPTSAVNTTLPATQTAPVVPPAATEVAEKPESIPPIPSPPQTLLVSSGTLAVAEPHETGEKEQAAANIIPPLEPDQLIYGRTPAQQRASVSVPMETDAAKAETQKDSQETAQPARKPSQPTDEEVESPESPETSETPETPEEVPLVAVKTEEETVPLVAIASDKKQEDSDAVPLVHISSTEKVSREGSQGTELAPLAKPPQ